MLHIPVLLEPVLQVFQSSNLKIFIDATLGAGGHAKAILETHPEIELYIGCDQDKIALNIAEESLKPWKEKLLVFHTNYENLPPLLEEKKLVADGILLDIGVSSMQLDTMERGFSFRGDSQLDMRMDQTQKLSAKEIVNTYSQEDLGEIFRLFGEEKRWFRCAEHIVKKRREAPIETTLQLKQILEQILGKKRFGEKEPVTQIFQALRIATNRELEVLENFLPSSLRLLRKGGRIGVISFHSLEDRIVKNFFKQCASDKASTSGRRGLFLDKIPEVRIMSSKPIGPSPDEIVQNPRAKSAKLRAVEKL